MDQSVFLTRSEFESLSTLYKSAWFYRLWIWQEIQLANAKSRLKCGEHGMLWQEFCNAVQVLRHQRIFVKSDDGSGSGSGVDDDEWIQWTAHLTHVDRICRFIPNQTSVNLFKATIEAECSNERDRIYGMLALFPKDEITLEANYTQTVEEVYQAAVENYFDNTHSLDIVMLCELCDGSKEKKPNLPGWVPDFSVMRERSEVLSRIITRQGAYYGRRRVVVEGQVLKAPGAKIGAVTGVFQCQVTPGSPEREVAEVLLEAARALNLDLDGEYLTTRETTGKAIARALCLDWFNDRYHPPRTNYWSEATITGLSRLHEARDSELSTEENQFLENGRRWLRRRSVFATDSGHIGLGPASLKVKDLIVNLVGCVMPLALRACPRNQYQHVGEAYCQGAMRGESVLGALPPDIDLVFTNPTRYPAYINRKIGSLQVGDPRLDGVDVPGGWSRVEHEEEDLFTIWREEDTGKEYKGDFFDPRLTIDELEKRGVVFEYFDII